jgi:branched-chain amino acid transport system permease protein
MIVLGGLGSIRGAALGAIFVALLPRVLDHYSGSLPLVDDTGSSGGLQPSQAARLIHGIFVIAVLLYLPGGLAGLGERIKRRRRPGRKAAAPESARRSSTELKETT